MVDRIIYSFLWNNYLKNQLNRFYVDVFLYFDLPTRVMSHPKK